MTMNYYRAGRVIREARKKRGLSQDELSALTGIIRTDISKIENGKVCRYETYERLAKGLNLSFRITIGAHVLTN